MVADGPDNVNGENDDARSLRVIDGARGTSNQGRLTSLEDFA